MTIIIIPVIFIFMLSSDWFFIFPEIIDAAKEKDIPIIFFNREPVEEDMRRWDKLYYVGGKAKQSGELKGELAADLIKVNPQADRNNDGKIQYVILEGEMGHQDAIIRTESVVESLKAKDRKSVV